MSESTALQRLRRFYSKHSISIRKQRYLTTYNLIANNTVIGGFDDPVEEATQMQEAKRLGYCKH